MDDRLFDALTKSMVSTVSRRWMLRSVATGAVATALVSGFARLQPRESAAQEAFAHFGCRHVGKPCKRARQCCSGLCRGPKGRQTCRQHNVGTCQAGQDRCANPTLGSCNGQPDCACFQTTGRGVFCGRVSTTECVECGLDADCAAVTGPGSACITTNGGNCLCPSQSACMAPCPA